MPLLLLSELFPPAVGGSAVLFGNIYGRVRDDVVVLTDAVSSPGCEDERRGALRILRRPIATDRWGLLDPIALRQHMRVAWQTRTLGADSVVHCGRALPEGLSAAIARTWGGPRFVVWTHGEDLITAATSRELRLLTRWVYRRASVAVANSRNTARLLEAFGVPRSKIDIVYPAVDADRFHPAVDGRAMRAALGIDDRTVLLLSVGRLQRRKGHDVMLRALARLSGITPPLHYVIVGDGRERTRLEMLARECGVRDRVTFMGEVADPTLPAWYAACDIFALPNRVDEDGDIEGFGIVFLEAAATGRPAIGGDSGGVPEAIERGVSGLLVDGASVEAVADAIRTLATNPPLRHHLGNAARARVLRRFTWERSAEQIGRINARVAGR
jgi:phosphatidyl-myo-inositol dimannoside synthase